MQIADSFDEWVLHWETFTKSTLEAHHYNPFRAATSNFLVLLCCTIWRHCIFYELFYNKFTIRYSRQKWSTFLLVRKLFISIHSAGFSKIILPFNHSFLFHSASPDVEIPFDWNKMLCMSFLIEEFTNINS